MTVYVPNVGEKDMLKDILAAEALVLGIFSNLVVPDGNTIFDTLTELLKDGSRAYAEKALGTDLNESALAADKWYITNDANGKALATYSNAAQVWTFNAYDVADGATAYGIFAFSWVLPFDAGTKEIKVGDIIKGVSSGATGIVTAVKVFSGSWALGTAAGELNIKTKTGTFQDNEDITKQGSIASVTVVGAGTGYAVGDILQITQAGGSECKIVVLTVNAGAILTVGVIEGGKGYATAATLPTTHLTGGGNDGATLTIASLATTKYAETNTGTVGDALKRLMFTDVFTAPKPLDTVGFSISYTPKMTLSGV
jgi:hypothetical protein